MKHLEGKEVYFVPTGNNRSRYGDNSPRKGVIVKVARVNATFKFKGSEAEHKCKMYHFPPMHLDSGFNSGWDVYETLDAYSLEKERDKIAEAVADKYRYASCYRNVDIATLRQVAKLLGVIIDDEPIEKTP